MTILHKNFLFVIAIVASIWYLSNNLLVVADIEQFMPADVEDKTAQILIKQSQKSALSNLVLAQISGADDKTLSRLSQALKSNLAKQDEVDFVINSPDNNNLKYQKLLKYRYLLHDNNGFSADNLQHNFEQLLTTFTANASKAVVQYLLTDPQRVFLDYLSLNQIKTTTEVRRGVWFIDNKALLMIQIQAESTIEQQSLAIDAIKSAFAHNQPGNATLLLSGPSVVAVKTRNNIQNTIMYVSFALILLMLFVFVFVYRSIYLLLLATITLTGSILIAITLTQIIFSQIHGIVLAFGITALGVCLDYPLHIFSNTSTKIRTIEAVKKILTPLKITAFTSIFAYVALIGSGFDGLTQLAVFAAIGLLTAFLISVYFIPMWMKNRQVNKRQISVWKPLSFKPKVVISLLVILLPMVFLSQQDNLLNTDISQFNPASVESKQVDAKLRQALGIEEVNHLFLAVDRDLEKVLSKTQSIQQQLKVLVKQGVITGSIGVDTLLPSKKIQKIRQNQLPKRIELQNSVLLAMKNLPFKNRAFDTFIDDVDSSRVMTLLDYQSLKNSIMGDKLQSLLFIQDDIWYSLVKVVNINDITEFNRQINDSDILKDTHYSISTEAGNIMSHYLYKTWVRLLAMLLLLFAVTLWFAYKNKHRIWIMLPVFSGILISLSVQVLLGNSINIFHLLSLLLVAGLGFDYSLFFNNEQGKIDSLANSTHAISISAITTIMTFSILAFSSVNVLSAIGQIVVVGVLSCFILAKLISTPTYK
ncbi:FIG021862: membrane protein, exporter [uncultured Candidatus Thioglobus sp.]|nr:FIG021862: membrane protein, exporter [uncultured Candidatus Thioglobus sp.]